MDKHHSCVTWVNAHRVITHLLNALLLVIKIISNLPSVQQCFIEDPVLLPPSTTCS